jgi:hypothetical protein
MDVELGVNGQTPGSFELLIRVTRRPEIPSGEAEETEVTHGIARHLHN